MRGTPAHLRGVPPCCASVFKHPRGYAKAARSRL